MEQLGSIIAGKTVAFDTAPLIYYIEEHPDYISVTDEMFGAIDRDTARGVTSVLTLLEVLVKPLREGRDDIADSYRKLLTSAANVTLHAVDEAISEQAARLRGKYDWLRTPDAIQIATALEHGADIIVTNDDDWRRISEFEVIVLKDYLTAAP